MPAGRPSDYSPELSAKICAQIAIGRSLRTICKEDSMPSVVTIFNWIAKNQEFLKQYEKAKEEQADALTEEMLDIADDGANDWMLSNAKDNPGWVANGEHVQRTRLRLDTRKWIASKLKPKKYGDKLDMNHGGQKDNPVVVALPEQDRAALEHYFKTKGVIKDAGPDK